MSVELHKNINLIVGKNGSGKTSFLEGDIFVGDRKKLQYGQKARFDKGW